MRLVASGISASDAKAIEQAIRAPADKPIELKGLTTGELPPAADYPHGLVYDISTGSPKYSTGLAWSEFGVIADGSVTNAKMANMAQATIKGRQAGAGTGAPEDLTAAQARTAIGVAIGSDVQAYHANLATLSGLPSAANLAAFAGLSLAGDRLPYANGAGTLALATFTAAGRALLDDADAAAQRATLGLGTIATQNASAVAITGGTAYGISGQFTANGFPGAGAGIEVRSDGTNGYNLAYNRSGGAWMPFQLQGLSFQLAANGTVRIDIAASGNTMLSGPVVQFSGIATTASAANAHLASGSGNSLLRSTSSARYKRAIETMQPHYADAILALRPVWYRSRCEADDPGWGWWGLIAEEVAAIDPRLVQWGHAEEDYESVEVGTEYDPVTGRQKPRMIRRVKAGAVPVPDGVAYERLPVLLLDLVKRLNARVAALEAAQQSAATTKSKGA